jgi:Tol biopolymer transport system component/predicted Ser/Thr protein kinase
MKREKGAFPFFLAIQTISGIHPRKELTVWRVTPLMINMELGRYRIVEKLGEGGMGQVYLAHDARLQRDVALKVLPSGALADETARKRFRKEALALSKLNHPSIEILYDFDTQDGVDFLAMEYVNGVTLKQMLSEKTLSEREITRLAVQIAEGCAAAHQAGIVHCDLKPANLMVTTDGRLKILDFGLAMLAQPIRSSASTDSSSAQKVGGTLPYMAPEQLTGAPVDFRTDVYGLGIVLYEMTTGRLPFHEGVSAGLVSDILTRLPPAPGRFRPEISARLEEIILKCLEKDSENRYQSAKEVLVDLRRLSASNAPLLIPADNGRRRFGKLRYAFAAAMVLMAVVLTIFLWHLIRNPSSVPEYLLYQVTRGTVFESQPAVSPDGKQIAYTSNASGIPDIYLVDNRGNNPIQLTNDPAADLDPAWFPDGSAIAFTSNREGSNSIWKVDPSSGGVTHLISNAEQPAISPDGKSILFCRESPSGYLRIWVTAIGTPSNARILTGDADGMRSHFNPAWSPDGTQICYASAEGIWTAPISGGRPRILIYDGLAAEPSWSPGGGFIYYSSYRGGARAVWRISKGGIPERVTTGTGQESHPDINRDGRLLCYASKEMRLQTSILDRATGKTTVLSALESDNMASMASIAPDKSMIVFPSVRGGSNLALWILPLDKKAVPGIPYKLTEQAGAASHPVFSPDGRWIAYYQIANGTRKLMIVDAHSVQPNQITKGPSQDTDPAWSPEGSQIVFVMEDKGNAHLAVARVKDGNIDGAPQWVATENVLPSCPAWSSDGLTIAFLGLKNKQSDLWLVPTDGSALARQITHGADGKWMKWDQSSGEILMSARFGLDRVSLYQVASATGLPHLFQPKVDFGSANAWGVFDISLDGSVILFSRTVSETGHIWTLEAVKGFF